MLWICCLGNTGLGADLLEDGGEDEEEEAGAEDPAGGGHGGLVRHKEKAAAEERAEGEEQQGQNSASEQEYTKSGIHLEKGKQNPSMTWELQLCRSFLCKKHNSRCLFVIKLISRLHF